MEWRQGGGKDGAEGEEDECDDDEYDETVSGVGRGEGQNNNRRPLLFCSPPNFTRPTTLR
jgi:hypothetical protein